METSVWETVLAILASFGGAGIIIMTVSKWLANLTAEKILKKAEFEFSRRLEALRSNLEKKNYISKIRFDLEIKVYRQLSESMIQMVMDNSTLFPYGLARVPRDEEEKIKVEQDNFNLAAASYNAANLAIVRNAPFIPQHIYEDFNNIRIECKKQLNFFPYHLEKAEGMGKVLSDCYNRTNEITEQMDRLLEKLRNHIASLDVLGKE